MYIHTVPRPPGPCRVQVNRFPVWTLYAEAIRESHVPLIRRNLASLFLLMFITLAAGCGDDDGTLPPPTGVLHLAPAAGTTIGAGQVITVLADEEIPGSAYPVRLAGTDLAWSSSRPDVAAVDADGDVLGIAAGDTIITARHAGSTVEIPIRVSGVVFGNLVQVPGQGARYYSVWAPADFAAGPALPALLALHGAGGTAQIQASMTLLNALGARQRALIVYPEGTGFIPTFNAGHCCGYAQSAGIDDTAYVRAILDDLALRFPVDAARIYAAGMSNGGMMSHRLACELADRLAGIASISGTAAQRDGHGNTYYACTPSRPIPILHVHATNDRTIPYLGGSSPDLSAPEFLPVESTIADWVSRNNLAPYPVAAALTPSTTCHRYDTPLDPSRPSAPVTLCKLEPVDVYDPQTGIIYGGGHSWPGGIRSPGASSDVPVQDFSVNDYLWSFFGG